MILERARSEPISTHFFLFFFFRVFFFQVVGSMCSLIGDVKDILPYSSTLLKYLKSTLVDSNMEVRAVAARALAALYKGIHEEEVEGYTDLREWLMETLRSDDTTPTIRSGCAQGLAQLLAVQGLEATSQLLPTLFAETKSDRAVVREGFFNLLGFLPDAFQQIFSIFVADVLPVIVEGLADEIALVREAALAAGQALVSAHFTRAWVRTAYSHSLARDRIDAAAHGVSVFCLRFFFFFFLFFLCVFVGAQLRFEQD